MKIVKRIWGGDDFFGPKHIFREKKMLSFLLKRLKKGCVLDAGCGKGDFSFRLLEKGFSVVGVDITDENLGFLKNRLQNSKFDGRMKLVKSELERVRFPKDSFDAIVCGEVLEHVKDDDKTLKNFNKFLKRGGHCIITTPMNMKYWNIDDEWASHNRRYSMKSFKKVVENNGFEISRIRFYGLLFNTYFFNVYLPILRKKLKKKEGEGRECNKLFNFLKRISNYFYWVFYFDDIFRYPPEKCIYLLADIKKVKEV